jgi:hypothetical protein
VIQKNVLYHKSTKGSEAIATRQHGLTPKLRSVLIMVDGKRTVEDLEQVARALGDPDALLGQLLEQGFIEPGATVAPPRESKPAPLPASPAVPAAALQAAQRFAARRLTDLLGPNAEDACMRIEGAHDLHELEVAIGRAEHLLREFKSGHVADEYMAEVQAHMPAGQ